MSFSGKKFKRARCENIEEILSAAKSIDHLSRLLQGAPVFSFTRNEGDNFTFTLHSDDRTITTNFTLGQETEMERRDGSKVRVTYYLESENVLKQTIKQPDGKLIYFRREFSDNETKMEIAVEGVDQKATIYYSLVE